MDEKLLAAIIGAGGVVVGGGLVMLKDYLQSKWVRRAEKEKWVRDKLHEIYSNCIFYLTHGGVPNYIYKDNAKGRELEYEHIMLEGYRLQAAHKAERLRWLNLLVVHHPARGTPAWEVFVKKVREGELKAEDVVELAATDPRLKAETEQGR